MKRVAVLGANGFLGSYICNNLRQHIILPVTRQTCTLTDFISVQNWLDHAEPNVIINCATSGGKTKLGEHDYQDLQNNLSIFLNFYNQSHKFKKFINIGSGAEFDKSQDLNSVPERNLVFSQPHDSYGLSKNIIARLCTEKENFYTLRLFGIFDKSEPDFRLLKKCMVQREITINDCEFDMISARDFLSILDHCINEESMILRDINCVYQDKRNLESIVRQFASIHNAALEIKVNTNSGAKNYSGLGQRLSTLGLDLLGLDAGLEYYG